VSGQLVGDVYAASPRLREGGLSKNGFLALLAIAEKCHCATRQGSVRWDHICDGLYGASKRTAKRAVRELRQAELIEVVKPGWANQHGESKAPIYELRIGPLVARSSKLDGAKSELDGAKSELDGATLGGPLDGSIDGSIDGGSRARTHEPPNPAAVPDSANAPPANNSHEEPRCERHRDPSRYPVVPNCIDCKNVRLQREQETAMKAAAEQAAQTAAAEARRAAIAACTLCDEHGWRVGPDGAALDPAIKCDHKPAEREFRDERR
jgi:hypothetical protein